MGLRDIGDTLPPGFRFYPSDEELVCHYLYKKIANEQVHRGTLVEIDLHTCEPWQLPDVAKLNSNEWYFFSFRDRKYATGYRTNRATTSGYWKATGKDRAVFDPSTQALVGMRKTLVFYKNRAPNGIKTGWIMHEFRLENPHLPPKEDWVLCRVFHKSRSCDQNSNNFSPQNMIDYSPNLATSPTSHDHAMPCLYQTINSLSSNINIQYSHHDHQQYHHEGQNPSTSLGLSTVEPENNFYLPSTSNNCDKLVEGSKCEDDYGFLFDIDYANNGSVPSNDLDHEMRFENGSSSVFM